MTLWILLVLALWSVQVFLPSTLFHMTADPESRRSFLQQHLRGRDEMPKDPPLVARAKRAQANMAESMPVFLGLALIHLVQGEVPNLADIGALVFVVSRALYVPAYLVALPGLRSAVWSGGFVGLILMAWPLIAS